MTGIFAPIFRPVFGPVFGKITDAPAWPGGSDPVPVYTPPTVTGGNEYDVLRSDGRLWRVHEFATSGELTVTDLGDDPTARVVLVGGGGSGGRLIGTATATGGGGAGGNVTDTIGTLTVGVHAVLVGAGAPPATDETNVPGNHGSHTVVEGLSEGYIAAFGGGGGGATSSGGDMSGGNGGGAGSVGSGRVGGAGERKGGDSLWTHPDIAVLRSSAGGAGAGSPGGDSSPGVGGDAGLGVQSDISGELRWYGAGAPGGVRSYSGTDLYPGQPAPGGVSAADPGEPGNAGENGTGAGGSGSSAAPSGRGGDGIVYISYPLEAAP